jgi:Protein of unknown function (DUF2786)
MVMADKTIMARLKKLLALSKSSNPHEAALALERAQLLMEEHGVSEDDLALADIGEFPSISLTTAINPPDYLWNLAGMVCGTFGVQTIFASGSGRYKFFGRIERAEVAAYTFDVLGRQLRSARLQFLKQQNKRVKRTTKIARADSYAEGWVRAASVKARRLAVSPQEQKLLEAFSARTYGETGPGKARPAREARGSSEAMFQGWRDGEDARLHAPMTSQKNTMLEDLS